MTSNPLPVNSSRLGGCTLTGALSVTSRIRDAATIVHGPKGCSHHNFSLLHATWLDNDEILLPDLVSTGLTEQDIVFGGEAALRTALDKAAGRDVNAVFVLSTCIVETIGDDVEAVCEQEYGIPVIHIPTAGFLGGTFQDGVNNALITLAGSTEPCALTNGVNIIGEMNLEYEVEENYSEIARLLWAWASPSPCGSSTTSLSTRISRLGAAQLNILRNPAPSYRSGSTWRRGSAPHSSLRFPTACRTLSPSSNPLPVTAELTGIWQWSMSGLSRPR